MVQKVAVNRGTMVQKVVFHGTKSSFSFLKSVYN